LLSRSVIFPLVSKDLRPSQAADSKVVCAMTSSLPSIWESLNHLIDALTSVLGESKELVFRFRPSLTISRKTRFWTIF